jgi:hypothetical protein
MLLESAGDCQVFPVMYGEFGSALEEERDLRVGNLENVVN